MPHALLKNPAAGDSLFGLVKHVSQSKMNEFAAVTGSVNAIHLDPSFAEKTSFGATLSPGTLLLGYISEMLVNNFGSRWNPGGEMEVKLIAPAVEGYTVVVGGSVRDVAGGDGGTITCDIWVKNHDDRLLIIGTAVL